MNPEPAILYLSRAAVAAVSATPAEVEAALERVFAAKAAGRTWVKPKFTLPVGAGNVFFAMGSASADPPYGCVKWSGMSPDNPARGLPQLHPLVVLNDVETGAPLAVMDGTWIFNVRSAGITAVAAKRLARPESSTVGFVACGIQARTHLAALRIRFPINRVFAFSVPRATAEAFAGEITDPGLQVTVVDQPKQAVEASDIIVSSVPDHRPELPPFLDPGWLPPGSFTSFVDLARPWHAEPLEKLDRVVTDDHAQSADQVVVGRLKYRGRFDADLGELVSGQRPGRRSSAERSAIIHPGLALGDLALAALLFERARGKGIGAVWPR